MAIVVPALWRRCLDQSFRHFGRYSRGRAEGKAFCGTAINGSFDLLVDREDKSMHSAIKQRKAYMPRKFVD